MTSKRSPTAEPEKKRALIVVRTYPVPAKSTVEASCTAAITDGGEWLRLFPIPWRYLGSEQRFRKYQWVEVSVVKAREQRPESYRLNDPSAITILSPPLNTARGWRDRKAIVLPRMGHCLCCLMEERDAHGAPTLGVFRPALIEKLVIEAESPNWTTSQLEVLRQEHLFDKKPTRELEKIPFSFSYRFRCAHESCRGHKLICTDWEMCESYRKWKRRYRDGWEAKFRQRYEVEMLQKNDTHFFVGTIHRYPGTWLICGLFYPPKGPDEPASLFSLA